MAPELRTGTTQVTTNKETRELVIERLFDAPRELVFKAWTESERLAQWFGPKGWTLPVSNLDFRPGGTWHYCMRGPEGEESWGKATYREIVEPERIVYLDTFSNAGGTKVEGMPEMVVTAEFSDQNGKTKLTSTTRFGTAEELQSVVDMGVVQGVTETWDRLEAYLAQS